MSCCSRRASRRAAGLGLLETVFAIFLLLGVFLVVSSLFHSSLRHASSLEEKVLARALASKALESLRTWAWTREGGRYNYDTWTGPGPWEAGGSDAEFPEYAYQAEITPLTLTTPCSTWESLDTARRTLDTSARRVKLTMFRRGRALLQVVSLLREPPGRELASLVVEPPSLPAPLARGATTTFRAKALDADGQEVPDVFFKWYLRPLTGNATIVRQSADGAEMDLRNVLVLPPNRTTYQAGTVQVTVRARYHGKDVFLETGPVVTLEGDA